MWSKYCRKTLRYVHFTRSSKFSPGIQSEAKTTTSNGYSAGSHNDESTSHRFRSYSDYFRNLYANRYKVLWTVARRFVRIAQVCVISFGIFTAGQTQGMLEYASNPQLADAQMQKTIIKSASSIKDVKIHDDNSPAYRRVKKLSIRVIESARELCEEKIATLNSKKAKSGKNFDVSDAEDLEMWQNALLRLHGKWKYIVIKDDTIVNAFVSALCPRRIFVLEGILDFCSDDELGLVLSHEISHLLLGHTEDRVFKRLELAILQLILLSLVDPSGLLSLVFEFGTFVSSFSMDAAFSRHHEEEADSLGLLIATAACFNTSKGVEFFQKLSEIEGYQVGRWHSSHPSSEDRHTSLMKLSGTKTLKEAYISKCYEKSFWYRVLSLHPKASASTDHISAWEVENKTLRENLR